MLYVTLISGQLVHVVQELHDLVAIAALCRRDNKDERLDIPYLHTDQVIILYYIKSCASIFEYVWILMFISEYGIVSVLQYLSFEG